MRLSSVFIIKQILNISQATGLRDPECGYSLSPLVFLRQDAREIMAKFRRSSSSSSRPVWCHDCNRGQHPAAREVSDDSAGQD